MFIILVKELLHGKSIGRALQNLELLNVNLKGTGIDLGSKSGSSSCYRFLQLDKDVIIKYCDLYTEGKNILKIDLERVLPIENDSEDFLILNNVLEHIFNFQICISETYRILRPGGTLVGSVPFIHKIHYDPNDYFRYTESSLQRIFSNAGYSDISIKPLGFGPFSTTFSLIAPFFKPKVLNVAIMCFLICVDLVINKILKNKKIENIYPVQYFFICKK